jgi:hypothetical protein
MTCYACASSDTLREKARVYALEQQNTDLLKIVMQLVDKRISFDARFSPEQLLLARDLEGMKDCIARDAAKRARIMIEQMLEDRRKFFHDYDLLKMHASREYWGALNKELLG